MKATRICNRLVAVNELVTNSHFADIVVQGLPESYRDIKLTTSKDPDCDVTKTQKLERGTSTWTRRNQRGRIAGHGTAMATILPVWFLDSPSR